MKDAPSLSSNSLNVELSYMYHLKDKLKAFFDLKRCNKSMGNKVFFDMQKYIYSKSLFNSLYILT